MAGLILCLAAVAQDARVDEPRVLELIAQCGSEVAEDREEALQALRAMGSPALPILKRAFPSLQGEAGRRVRRVIHEFADPAAWAREFVEEDTDGRDRGMEQGLRERTLDPKKAGRVLAEIVRHPAATANQRRYALDLARRHRLPGLWPAVLEALLREDGDESQALLLQNFRPPAEALPDLLKLLPKARSGALAVALLDAALRLRADAAMLESCIGALLQEGAPDARAQVLNRLRQGLVPVSAPALLAWWRRHADSRAILGEAILRHSTDLNVETIAELLASPIPEETGLAFDLVERRRMVAAGPMLLQTLEARPEVRARTVRTLRSLLADSEIRKGFAVEGSRRALVGLAADLRLTAAEPEILACLGDRDPAVRRAAASAAAALGFMSADKLLAALLRDREAGVRREALRALVSLKRSAATDVVLEHLQSSDPDLQAAAAEALPLVDLSRALAALATRESMAQPFRLHALAVLIAAGGPSVMEQALARLKLREPPADLLARVRLILALAER